MTSTVCHDLHQSWGFTLVEMIVTLGVLTVLATVSVPTFFAYYKKARKVECEISVRDFLRAQELYMVDNQVFYPLTLGEVNRTRTVRAGWNPRRRPDRADRYRLSELGIEFKPGRNRGYYIRARNIQRANRFEQLLDFRLRTNEGFHNDGRRDYNYRYFTYNRQARGRRAWSTGGMWMVRNRFWFDIYGCPAWQWSPPSPRY
jgi:prepilin-type N-terminal cleavage/methylation domain-containing protein